MKKRFIKMIRWPFGCLIFLGMGCHDQPVYKKLVITKSDSLARQAMFRRAFIQVAEAKMKIHTGDLITRTGNDFTSESLRSLNRRNTTYSHCGIASFENDSLFIYHALGGDFNPNEKIRRDAVEIFAEPYSNRGIGVFRFPLADSLKESVLKTVKSYYKKGIMFDMDFNLKTDDRMYCAEFIYKSFSRGTAGRLSFNHSYIGKFEFIGVDDLFLQPLCWPVLQIVYK